MWMDVILYICYMCILQLQFSLFRFHHVAVSVRVVFAVAMCLCVLCVLCVVNVCVVFYVIVSCVWCGVCAFVCFALC